MMKQNNRREPLKPSENPRAADRRGRPALMKGSKRREWRIPDGRKNARGGESGPEASSRASCRRSSRRRRTAPSLKRKRRWTYRGSWRRCSLRLPACPRRRRSAYFWRDIQTSRYSRAGSRPSPAQSGAPRPRVVVERDARVRSLSVLLSRYLCGILDFLGNNGEFV